MRYTEMLAFIDESGDAGMKLAGGSSPYFCILAVIFQDQFSAGACDRAIDNLRRRTNRFAGYEYHFSHCPDSARMDFLRCVAAESFQYHAFVIDKRKLYAPRFSNPKAFYEFAVNIVCENAGDLMRNGKVVIDKNGNREFLQQLRSTLTRRTNPEGQQIVHKVKMENSKSNNLVQLADMVCGAVARSVTSDDQRYRDVIRKKGREKRVQCWPK